MRSSVGTTIRIPAVRREVDGAARQRPATARRPRLNPPPAKPIVNPAPKESIRPATHDLLRCAAGRRLRALVVAAQDAAFTTVPARVFEAMSAPFVTEPLALEVGGRCVSVGAVRGSRRGRRPAAGHALGPASRRLAGGHGVALAARQAGAAAHGPGRGRDPDGRDPPDERRVRTAPAPAEIVAQFDCDVLHATWCFRRRSRRWRRPRAA